MLERLDELPDRLREGIALHGGQEILQIVPGAEWMHSPKF